MVDPAKVAAAVEVARETLGMTIPPAPPADGQGVTGGSVHDGPGEPRFEDVFGPH